MKIQCMIVDDEPHAVRMLESYVQQVNQLQLAATCNNAMEAFDMLRRKKIDLVFLDIKMPVITGIDFLKSRADPPKIIFTTACRGYALEGFELDVIDYLLKPVSYSRFLKAVAKLSRQLQLQQTVEFSQPEYTANRNSFLYFKVDKATKKVVVEDILYMESAKDYTNFFLLNGRCLLVKQSICSLETMLSGHRFIRVHRSYLVAVNKIDSFTSNEVIVFTTSIPVGRLYKSALTRLLLPNKRDG